MNRYTHLTIIEREKILEFKSKGKSIRQIAKLLCRNASTISRELKRNVSASGYSPSKSQTRYIKARESCRKKPKLETNLELLRKIRHLIVHKWWSPEQIYQRMKKENHSVIASTSTIYRGFKAGYFSTGVKQQLRRHKRTGKSKAPLKGGQNRKYSNSIHNRPDEANRRLELGHLEGDTIHVKNGVILTMVDRFSRMTFTKFLKSYDSTNLSIAVKNILGALPENRRKTITLDNGSEFAAVPDLEKTLGLVSYFCDPASPKQKATIENTNGLLRQFFPKKSLTFSPQLQLDFLTELLNLRPRKCLNWHSPFEVQFNKVLHLT